MKLDKNFQYQISIIYVKIKVVPVVSLTKFVIMFGNNLIF